MKSRSLARRLAVAVLYEAEIKEASPLEVFRARSRTDWQMPEEPDDERGPASGFKGSPASEVLDYVYILVAGVDEGRERIDALIAASAEHWGIERMPVVDANVLRVGAFELSCRLDVPVAVVINEAVELAKTLSTEDSGRFVNGVLGRVAETRSVR
ncbi:MAG: transcription antitermination factor NusB [Actinobacteria bacterium]|jgi:N utilization substance protein B|nr:transcription antitermination factor NusB [Actinomycetota bacterium]